MDFKKEIAKKREQFEKEMKILEIKQELLDCIENDPKYKVSPYLITEFGGEFCFSFKFNTPREIYNFLSGLELREIVCSKNNQFTTCAPLDELKEGYEIVLDAFKIKMVVEDFGKTFPVKFVGYTTIKGYKAKIVCELNYFNFPLKAEYRKTGSFGREKKITSIGFPPQYYRDGDNQVHLVNYSNLIDGYINFVYLYQELDILLRGDLFPQV